jgi:hypothetical protein
MKTRLILAAALAAASLACMADDRVGTVQAQPAPASGQAAAARTGESLADVIVGASDYVAYPLAPNWSVHETALAEDRVRVELKLNRLHLGGDGQALQVLRTRADEIAREGGFSSYRIARYEEGIDSGWISQRTATGELVFSR